MSVLCSHAFPDTGLDDESRHSNSAEESHHCYLHVRGDNSEHPLHHIFLYHSQSELTGFTGKMILISKEHISSLQRVLWLAEKFQTKLENVLQERKTCGLPEEGGNEAFLREYNEAIIYFSKLVERKKRVFNDVTLHFKNQDKVRDDTGWSL